MPDVIDAKEFADVLHTVHDPASDDRTVAVMAASYVDIYLGMLVRTKMPGLNSTLKTKLFDGYGPLATLAAKIDIARALGLITKACQDNLIVLNRVRNKFAHSLHIHTFDHPVAADLCAKLDAVSVANDTFPGMPQTYPIKTHRQHYAAVATFLGAYLHNQLVSAGVTQIPLELSEP